MTNTYESCLEEIVALIHKCVHVIDGNVPCDMVGGHKVYWTTHGLLLLEDNRSHAGYYLHNNQTLLVLVPHDTLGVRVGILGGERDWKPVLSDVSGALLTTVAAERCIQAIRSPKMIEMAKDQLSKARAFMEGNKVTWIN